MSQETPPTVPLGTLLIDIQTGFASGQHNSTGEGIPHFRPMNVSQDGSIERAVIKYVDPTAGRPDLRLQQGDVVFNNTNSPELVGKTALFEDNDTPAFSNHMTRLRVKPSLLDPSYLALRLHQAWREGWFAAHCNNHVSQASIGRDVLRSFEIELPPIETQRAIANLARAINERRASASKRLGRASSVIERFRQAIFSAALAGSLTTDWRQESSNSGMKINLEEIRQRRRSELGRRFSEPEINTYAHGSDLPENWQLVPLGLMLTEIKYGTSRRSEYGIPGVPVLRIPNISGHRLDIGDLKFADLDERERLDLALRADDVLMIRSNGSVQLVGKAAKVTDEAVGMSYAGYLMRLRPDSQSLDSNYLTLAMASHQVRLQIEMPARSTSGVHNINTEEVKSLGIPLPPIEEQRVIVERASQMLKTADELVRKISAATRHVERTSQAVLNKAFRGELSAAIEGTQDGLG